MLYFAFPRPDNRTHNISFNSTGSFMLRSDQLSSQLPFTSHVGGRGQSSSSYVVKIFSPGLVFPHHLYADAGGTHPPPNLASSLKGKR